MNCSWTFRAVALICAVIHLGLPLGSARASDRGSPRAIPLAGQSTIRLDRSAVLTVRLPTDVHADAFRARFPGRGRAVGFALVALKNGGVSAEGPAVTAFRLNLCREKGCADGPRSFTTRSGIGLSDGLILPSGLYRLYLVADGAPISFRFAIDGLQGTIELVASDRLNASVRTLQSIRGMGPDTNVFASGGYETVSAKAGIGFLGMWALGTSHTATAFGSCYRYPQSPRLPREVAFAPGCPAGDSHPRVHHQAISEAEGGFILTSVNYTLPEGIGGWYSSAAEIDSSGAVGLWLPFT